MEFNNYRDIINKWMLNINAMKQDKDNTYKC